MVRKAQGKDVRKSIPPVHHRGGNILTNDADEADAINDYFFSQTFEHNSYHSTWYISKSGDQIRLHQLQTVLNLNRKILEGIVCDPLDNYLAMNELIHPNQWVYKSSI